MQAYRAGLLLTALVCAWPGRCPAADAKGASGAHQPPASARATIAPARVTHTLPSHFWGVTGNPYYHQHSRDPLYRELACRLRPEVYRICTEPRDVCLPETMDSTWEDLLSLADAMHKACGTVLHPLLYSMPRKPVPTSIAPEVKSNYDDDPNDGRSPQGIITWLRYLQSRYGKDGVIGVEIYNEPATFGGGAGGGNGGDWYSKATVAHPDRAAADWATVHTRQYYEAFKAAGPDIADIPVNGASYAEGGKTSQEDESEIARFLDGYKGWPWSTPNTRYIDALSFHGYNFAVREPDNQALMNQLFYPQFVAVKGGYLSSVSRWRQMLDQRGGRTKGLTQTESYVRCFRPDGAICTNDRLSALMEVGHAILSANMQHRWNLRAYLVQALTDQWITDDKDTGPSAQGSPDDGMILREARPGKESSRGAILGGNVRYYTLKQIVGPFLHNYKRQLAMRITGAGPTPPSSADNALSSRIQGAAGKSADGKTIGIMVANFDLTNPQTVTFDVGAPISGAPNGVVLGKDQGWTDLPVIGPIEYAGSTFTRSLGPGEAYLFVVPISKR